MQIRTRLTLQFVGIVAVIVLISHLAIYFSSAYYRENQFYDRLRDKANTTAELLIKVDAVNTELLKIIDQNKKDVLYKENVTIYNYLNEELYTSNDTVSFGSSPGLLNKIRLEGEQHWRQGDFEVIGVLYVDKFNRFAVTAGAIDRYGKRKLENLSNILMISFFLILVIVAWSGWIYSGRALRPINLMIEKVNTISATNLSTRLNEGNKKDEIARLSATFNEMLARVETTFQLQKAFVANASHELKNPLTIITSQIEVLLLRERTPEEYHKTLCSVLEDVRKLNVVSLRLLDLARLNSDEIKVDFKPLRIDELIWQCKDELHEKHPEYKIIFSPDLPDEERQLIVLANEYLLKTAFVNLIDNACKFNPSKEIQISLQTLGSRIIIRFKDDGIGIGENDLPFIFQPFYRGLNVVTISGHGIGLSLVEKIVKLHKAQIAVNSQVNKGSVFTVTIPSASVI
ncbi:HAMP domain-containing sensor histidine kinase [soil metagenome]